MPVCETLGVTGNPLNLFLQFLFRQIAGSGAGLQSSTQQSSLQPPEDITGDIQ